MKMYQINGFLSIEQQTIIAVKSLKIGYDCSFEEYGSTTFITFTKMDN